MNIFALRVFSALAIGGLLAILVLAMFMTSTVLERALVSIAIVYGVFKLIEVLRGT